VRDRLFFALLALTGMRGGHADARRPAVTGSTARALRAVDDGATATGARSWIEVLGDAVRPEFRADVYFPAHGEPILLGRACRVAGCLRRGNSRPERSGERYLCMTHGEDWISDGGHPAGEWLAEGVTLRTACKRRLTSCRPAA
jgi:hypothetical protein